MRTILLSALICLAANLAPAQTANSSGDTTVAMKVAPGFLLSLKSTRQMFNLLSAPGPITPVNWI
jgi:hypothetical protein